MSRRVPGRPSRFEKVDLGALHRILWRMSDGRRHRLELDQVKLAAELDCTKFTINRCMAKLVEAGMVRSLGRSSQHVLYVIYRPLGVDD